MKTTIVAVLCGLSFMCANAGEVASISFRTIEPLLTELVVQDPAVKEKYAALLVPKNPLAKIDADEDGKVDLRNILDSSKNLMVDFALKNEFQNLLKRKLYKIISDMGLEYTFIYDSFQSNHVLYAAEDIDDITQILRQKLFTMLEQSPDESKADNIESQH